MPYCQAGDKPIWRRAPLDAIRCAIVLMLQALNDVRHPIKTGYSCVSWMTNILNPASYRDCIVSHHAQRIGTMYYVQWTMPSTGVGYEDGNALGFCYEKRVPLRSVRKISCIISELPADNRGCHRKRKVDVPCRMNSPIIIHNSQFIIHNC